MSDEVLADIRRMWGASHSDEESLDADAFEILDRATEVRRATADGLGPAEGRGPEWAAARLSEGLSRLLVARHVAAWGNRSYMIQALEASLDGLRDAAAHLPDGFSPSRDEVLAFRARLMVEWRAVQSEADMDRIAGLSLASLRG